MKNYTKLSLNKLKSLVKNKELVIDNEFTENVKFIFNIYDWVVFTGNNKFYLLMPEVSCLVFDSATDIVNYVQLLKEMNSSPMEHPLKMINESSFLNEINYNIENFCTITGVQIICTIEFIKQKNNVINKMIKKIDFIENFNTLFPMLMTIIGETIINETNGRWIISEIDNNFDIWIESNNKKYNPYIIIYKKFVEHQDIDLYTVVVSSLNAYSYINR